MLLPGKRSLLVFAVTAFGMLSPSPVLAAADLMVYPTRVVMTDRNRTAQVDIVNSGDVQATYKMTLARKRMTQAGEFRDITTPEPGEKFADNLVKYSPRQVTLVPGAAQTIRMLLKIPQGLPEGEYRSHLVFSKPPSAVSELPQDQKVESNGLAMKISVNVGVSIPVIVRHGNLEAKAAIDPLSVKVSPVKETPDGPRQVVNFDLARTGTRSVYGDVLVYRDKEKIAESKGLAVYTPNHQRTVGVTVVPPSIIKSGDELRIVFTERDEKNPVVAETTVRIR